MKTIAVDLDDTLNDFTETLQREPFEYRESSGLCREKFDEYLARVRGGAADPGELVSTDYTFFRATIHLECYRRAKDRPGAVEFMRWLKREGWRVVLCTYRDLRRSGELTRSWLDQRGIPFDYLFCAANKIVFCKLWEIPILVDDDVLNIEHGGRYGVKVYYPKNSRNQGHDREGARGFDTFDEVRAWVRS